MACLSPKSVESLRSTVPMVEHLFDTSFPAAGKELRENVGTALTPLPDEMKAYAAYTIWNFGSLINRSRWR